ncbi:MAG: DUF938 domain-containing protein [Henriciella sp.]
MTERDDIGSSGKAVALEHRETAEDGRRYSPSAGRNKQVISDVLGAHMPVSGRILEIASGTGEHGAHFVAAHHALRWTYSDVDEISLASQAAWVAHDSFGGRLSGPLKLDASADDWDNAVTGQDIDAIFCANMIHIAPFEVAKGLIAGAGRLLEQGGRLCLYGPFARKGVIAPSNARFSEDLKRRDPSWGVRDLDLEIVPLAEAAGLDLKTVIEMPANNLTVVFQKA